MTDIRARVIADSIGEHSSRLFTVETRAPTMIHQEVLRHRRLITEEGMSVLGLGWEPDFSYSVSSTRAVPFAKLLQEVRDPALRAAPVHWGSAQRGMVPGDELDDTEKCINWREVVQAATGILWDEETQWITKRECAKRLWDFGATTASRLAETMVAFADPHKSIPNRMIAPYGHYNVLMTGTEPGWLNAMGLRLDGAADPIVRALFEKIWIEWSKSEPRTLRPGEWHLPYADDDQSLNEAIIEAEKKLYAAVGPECEKFILETQQKMSVARCAHLSYTSFETGDRMTVEQCLNLYQRLVGSVPIHASPAEHQATPDEIINVCYSANRLPDGSLTHRQAHSFDWKNQRQGGNLGPGWIQLRKMLPNEGVAPLPEAYR